MDRFGRRFFLGLGVGALAWAACGRDGEQAESTSPTPGTQGTDLNLTVVSAEIALRDRRLAVAALENGKPARLDAVGAILIPKDGDPVSVTPSTTTIRFGLGGEGQNAVTEEEKIYVVEHDFDRPGTWRIELRTGESDVSTPFQVLEDSQSPMVGEPALRSESPTLSDPRGVSPICTRNPPCTQHDMTIAEAVTSGRPSVVSFVTPALCMSRTCGPALDIIEDAKQSSGEGVNFVHVEIYTDQTGKEATQPVKDWALPGEPWIVFVGADGNVKARWSGALGTEEFPDGLEALKAGTL